MYKDNKYIKETYSDAFCIYSLEKREKRNILTYISNFTKSLFVSNLDVLTNKGSYYIVYLTEEVLLIHITNGKLINKVDVTDLAQPFNKFISIEIDNDIYIKSSNIK